MEADLVVHGAGREPSIEGLDLDQAGVKYADEGIIFLQSLSNLLKGIL